MFEHSGVLAVLGCFILAGTILDVVLNGAFVKTKTDKFQTIRKREFDFLSF